MADGIERNRRPCPEARGTDNPNLYQFPLMSSTIHGGGNDRADRDGSDGKRGRWAARGDTQSGGFPAVLTFRY
ncbi:MAG: hypothetical protein D6725_08510 [Planctomycetota bacterium]|nr:MAG: hypothetical protein D6725_08510 [Planctomycetota bacterium]